jgi:hypothetical protein
VGRLYLRWPLSLWQRFTVNGVVRTDAPADWPREPCWLWIGAKNGTWKRPWSTPVRGGYGYVRKNGKGKPTRVHVLTYEALRGPMPPGLVPRHTCDRENCGNPWHTEPGTQGENISDQYKRGRRNGGRASQKEAGDGGY